MRIWLNSICLKSILVGCFFSLGAVADVSLLREGGVSGGGGNVISPTPPDQYIDPNYAEHIVKHSVDDVKSYFFESERRFRQGLPNEELQYAKIYQVLFAEDVDIQNIIKRNFPEIEDKKPCFDFTHKPVDGSFNPEEEHTICISAYNLAKKVNRKEMSAQAIALMVHEYVELAGLSDDDAVILQKKALQDLK